MGWDGQLFQEKINYLFENLFDRDIDELTDCFCKIEGDDKTYRGRKNLIRDFWLREPLKTPIRFITKKNFKSFNIARLNIEGEMAFSYSSLVDEPLDSFKRRVDRFKKLKEREPASYKMEYRYIYYFTKEINKIVYVKFDNIEQVGYKKYLIDAIPQHGKLYKAGNLTINMSIEENLIRIEAKNSHEQVSLYFGYDLVQAKNNTLWGVGVSKFYNTEPRASKALLSKTELTIDEKIICYLNANESEYLVSKEPKESEKTVQKEQFYLDKYYSKIGDLFTLSQKIRRLFRGKLVSNIYLNIFFSEFKSFVSLYQKVTQEKKYFVTNKKRAMTIFLESMRERKSSCFIVYPLCSTNANLLVNREEAIASIELNIEVVKEGVEIHRIFVIESMDEVDTFVLKTVEKMNEAGIDISFAFKKDIESVVSSYDFSFPIEKDVVLHKERTKKLDEFSINLDKSTISLYVNNYKLIKEESFSIEELLALKDEKSHESYMPKENFLFSQDREILQKLLLDDGIWYFYSYPSHPNRKERVWSVETQFFENFTLIDAYRNKGEFFISTHQTIVVKEANNSKNMTAIVFDNSKISYDILPFSRISKSNGVEESMLTFGFFSRREFSEDEAVKILGDIDRLQLKIDYKFVQRVTYGG